MARFKRIALLFAVIALLNFTAFAQDEEETAVIETDAPPADVPTEPVVPVEKDPVDDDDTPPADDSDSV